MKILMFVLMFFVVSALLIISNNNLEMYKSENISKFNNLYFKWVDEIYSNIQSITGNVVKLDWLPQDFSDESNV
jgi:hypothetical protein